MRDDDQQGRSWRAVDDGLDRHVQQEIKEIGEKALRRDDGIAGRRLPVSASRTIREREFVCACYLRIQDADAPRSAIKGCFPDGNHQGRLAGLGGGGGF